MSTARAPWAMRFRKITCSFNKRLLSPSVHRYAVELVGPWPRRSELVFELGTHNDALGPGQQSPGDHLWLQPQVPAAPAPLLPGQQSPRQCPAARCALTLGSQGHPGPAAPTICLPSQQSPDLDSARHLPTYPLVTPGTIPALGLGTSEGTPRELQPLNTWSAWLPDRGPQ